MGDLKTRALACTELDLHGGLGSDGCWWAFEGFTRVDLCISTEKMLLFIEGKRNEGISRSTEWYPQRSQLVRNLEAVGELAGDRHGAVLLITEKPISGELMAQTVKLSTPHLAPLEQDALVGRYLGQTTWAALCAHFNVGPLPDTKDQALQQLEAAGRVVNQTHMDPSQR